MIGPPEAAPWLHSVDQVRNMIVNSFDTETAEALLVVRDKYQNHAPDMSECSEWVDSVLVDALLVIIDKPFRDAFRRDA